MTTSIAVTIVVFGVTFGIAIITQSYSLLGVISDASHKWRVGILLTCLLAFYAFSLFSLNELHVEMLGILLAAYILGVVSVAFRLFYEEDFSGFCWLASLSCMAVFAVLGSGILNTIIGSLVGAFLYIFRKRQIDICVEFAVYTAVILGLIE